MEKDCCDDGCDCCEADAICGGCMLVKLLDDSWWKLAEDCEVFGR